jgi:antitoxin (DNA-binding transcriptional repressor) of toxin-antitoxin stability system
MKTATLRELRNRYRYVIGWVEAGEEVAISKRGKIIARLVPEKPKSGRVDWTRSAALGCKRQRRPFLSATVSASLLAESQGMNP